MARAKEIDFSSQVAPNNKEQPEKSDDAKETNEAEQFNRILGDAAKDENKDVIIVLRDRKNLSLALRKLNCGSDCFSPPLCACRKRKDSSGSIVSFSSQPSSCCKCNNARVIQYGI